MSPQDQDIIISNCQMSGILMAKMLAQKHDEKGGISWGFLSKNQIIDRVESLARKARESCLTDERTFQRSLVHIMNFCMFGLDNLNAFEFTDDEEGFRGLDIL